MKKCLIFLLCAVFAFDFVNAVNDEFMTEITKPKELTPQEIQEQEKAREEIKEMEQYFYFLYDQYNYHGGQQCQESYMQINNAYDVKLDNAFETVQYCLNKYKEGINFVKNIKTKEAKDFLTCNIEYEKSYCEQYGDTEKLSNFLETSFHHAQNEVQKSRIEYYHAYMLVVKKLELEKYVWVGRSSQVRKDLSSEEHCSVVKEINKWFSANKLKFLAQGSKEQFQKDLNDCKMSLDTLDKKVLDEAAR